LAISEEAVLAKQARIEALAGQQRGLEEEMSRVGLSVVAVSLKKKRLRREVAKGRAVK
jgi:hypothetical protein